MTTPQTSPANRSLVHRTAQLIGNSALLEAIRQAIEAPANSRQTLYFVGPGGLGKTRLLEEVAPLCQTWSKGSVKVAPIVDLYHPDNHSASGLRDTIAYGLDPDKVFFKPYHDLRQEYQKRRNAGAPYKILDALRRDIERVFSEAYTSLAQQTRVVLRFDTLELVQYESDAVQDICRVEDVETTIKNWMLRNICQWPNTVVLLAGRPQPEDQRQVLVEFQQTFVQASHSFQHFELQPFVEAETLEYLASIRQQDPGLAPILTPANCKKLHAFTKGRPIYLALLIDLAYVTPRVLDIEPPVDEPALRLQLVELLQQELGGHLGTVVDILTRARKGLDFELLRALVGNDWTETEMGEAWLDAQKLAIVKRRTETATARPATNGHSVQPTLPRRERLFLHDEVYELFDEYYRNTPDYGLEFKGILNYYRGRLPLLTGRDKADWQVEQLYYEFQVNPRFAYYQCYVPWDEMAIRAHEIGQDMRLRDEGLRFINRYVKNPQFQARRVCEALDLAAIDRDCAVRWVKRYVARGQMHPTLKISQGAFVARELYLSPHPLFKWDSVNDLLYQGTLLAAWGEALMYSAGKHAPSSNYPTINLLEDPMDLFRQAIPILETNRQWDEHEEWLRLRTLGRLYNNIGYLHRIRGEYHPAHEHYKRALAYFTAGDSVSPDEEASTRTNLAYVLTMLGRYTVAHDHLETAIYARQQLGQLYPLTLSRNMLGILYTYEEHPDWGQRESENALAMAEELEDARLIGLACIALGFALRKRGDEWKKGERICAPDQAEEFFKEGERYLRRALTVFPEQVDEPIREWEAHNELGSLYCDWAWLAWRGQNDPDKALGIYQQSFESQTQALDKANEAQTIDSLDDLAQTYGDLQFLYLNRAYSGATEAERQKWLAEAMQAANLAEQYLNQVETRISPEYHLVPGQKFSRSPGESDFQALGKARYLRVVWQTRNLELGEVPEKKKTEAMNAILEGLFEAIAYFEQFWPRSNNRRRVVKFLSTFLRLNRVSANDVQQRWQEFSEKYSLDPTMMKETISDVLGSLE